MNYRTTLILLVVAVGAGTFVLLKPAPPEKNKAPEEPETSRDLLDPKPGTLVEFVYARPGKETLTFVKNKKADDADEWDKWELTMPVAAKAVDWTVNALANKVRDLKYVDTNTDTADETSGLGAPRATFTIKDAAGKSHTIKIGKQAAGDNTFVRLDDKPGVYIVEGTFDTDLKKKVEEYRDKDLVDLTTADASEISIVYEGKQYTITRDEKKDWVFSAPFTGYGDNSKLRTVLDGVNYLRAAEIVEDNPSDLGRYGLAEPKLTIQVTTKKQIASSPDETTTDAAADPNVPVAPSTAPAAPDAADEPKFETATVGMAFGNFDLEEKNVYAKPLGQAVVVLVSKFDYEKFVPKPDEWRDLKLTRATGRSATKVELTHGGETATLTKQGTQWRLGDEDADLNAVNELLSAVADLTVRSYREVEPGQEATFGMDAPRAVLTLTIPGRTDPEVITVGGESKSRTMAYVRRGSAGSIGVINAGKVEKLLQPAVAYHDRKIHTFSRTRATRIDLWRKDGDLALGVEKGPANVWSLTSPITGAAETQAVNDLLADLSNLRAKKVVAKGAGDAFGLNDPDVRVTVTVEVPAPPVPASKPAATQPATTQPAATQPAATTQPAKPAPKVYALAVTKRGEKVYAQKQGSELIYEIDPVIHEHLMAELLTRSFVTIQGSQVVGLEIVRGDPQLPSHEFSKDGDDWTYLTDADVPLDATKVKPIIDKLPTLRAERYIAYADADLAQFGLDKPDYTLTITREDGDPIVILIAATGPDGAEGVSRYAALGGANRVFLLNAETVESFDKKVADFEKAAR